jgi:hypothetical protein
VVSFLPIGLKPDDDFAVAQNEMTIVDGGGATPR